MSLSNQKLNIMLNDIKYLGCKCIVFKGTTSYTYKSVRKFLDDQIIENNRIFSVGIQDSLFDNGDPTVLVYLED